MKKNIVQRNGKKSSAPWPPIAGRAIPSRMNRRIASNMFMNRPRVTRLCATCRASGMTIRAIRIAASTSMTMNRVTWNPRISGRWISVPMPGSSRLG